MKRVGAGIYSQLFTVLPNADRPELRAAAHLQRKQPHSRGQMVGTAFGRYN